jgi:hypothetical protein
VWHKLAPHTQFTIEKQRKPKTAPFSKLSALCGNFSAHTHSKRNKTKTPQEEQQQLKNRLLLFQRKRKTTTQQKLVLSVNIHF